MSNKQKNRREDEPEIVEPIDHPPDEQNFRREMVIFLIVGLAITSSVLGFLWKNAQPSPSTICERYLRALEAGQDTSSIMTPGITEEWLHSSKIVSHSSFDTGTDTARVSVLTRNALDQPVLINLEVRVRRDKIIDLKIRD